MRILIVASSNRESVGLTASLKQVNQISAILKCYRYGNMEINILNCGYGSVFTTYHLSSALKSMSYDLAINIGLAGSFDHFLEQGFVVNVVQDQLADLGIEHNHEFFSLPEEELMDENSFPFTEGKLNNLGTFELDEVESLIPVKGITVNNLRNDQNWIKEIKRKYAPEVQTMNGAAFFYVCLMEKIPFLQIKSIANFVEITHVDNWNIPAAIDNLTSSVINIFDELNA